MIDWLLVDATRWGNVLEALLWFGLAAALARKARLAALWLVLFGGSDLVETTTGAWWDPWWLLLWKAACIAGLLAAFVAWRRGLRPG